MCRAGQWSLGFIRPGGIRRHSYSDPTENAGSLTFEVCEKENSNRLGVVLGGVLERVGEEGLVLVPRCRGQGRRVGYRRLEGSVAPDVAEEIRCPNDPRQSCQAGSPRPVGCGMPAGWL